MATIADLTAVDETVADGDLLALSNTSKGAGFKDQKLSITKLRTDAFLGVASTWTAAQTFSANQRIDALLGVNAAPSTDAQVVVVSGVAGRRALSVKAATSPTVPAFELMDSSDVARHQLWADYSTNIRAARLMGTYQEFLIQPGTIVGTSPGPAQTLTVTIVGTAFPRQAVYVEAIGTFFNSADNTTTRAMFIDDVTFSTRLNSSTSATIGVNTRRGSDINGVTVTGPTAVNGGISYTVSNAAANLQRAALMLRIQSSQFVTVTASVA